MSCPGATLPVNLKISKMQNSSPNLTNFFYDFIASNFKGTKGCPDWMKANDKSTLTKGCLKIQPKDKPHTIKFTGIGNLKLMMCYYFPESLNLYDGKEPEGGEFLIEFRDKSPPEGIAPEDAEKIFMFIPVDLSETKATSLFEDVLKDSGAYFNLNDFIPRAPFWFYDDVSLPTTCTVKTKCIFFIPEDIEQNKPSISDVEKDNIIAEVGILAENSIEYCDSNGLKISYKSNDIALQGRFKIDEQLLNPWYSNGEQPGENKCKDETIELCNTMVDTCVWTGKCEKKCETGLIVRDKENIDVKKGSIFKNMVGTTRGPGLHNNTDDPFSLTCEPIIDADDETPIDAKDRLEWVKNVYNGIPSNMKNMFMALIFICILIVILTFIHIVIFKQIGLFITQNEIADRVNN
jgi:hypothetical protein